VTVRRYRMEDLDLGHIVNQRHYYINFPVRQSVSPDWSFSVMLHCCRPTALLPSCSQLAPPVSPLLISRVVIWAFSSTPEGKTGGGTPTLISLSYIFIPLVLITCLLLYQLPYSSCINCINCRQLCSLQWLGFLNLFHAEWHSENNNVTKDVISSVVRHGTKRNFGKLVVVHLV
jgi:hypothetical protein